MGIKQNENVQQYRLKLQNGSGFESVLLFLGDTMEPLILHKASTLIPQKVVEDTTIYICKSLSTISTEEATKIYKIEAKATMKALWDTLPGGTLDRLIAYLLEKKSTNFKTALK